MPSTNTATTRGLSPPTRLRFPESRSPPFSRGSGSTTTRSRPRRSEPRYRFDIRTDGVETTCRGSLPLNGCSEPNVVCEGEGTARIVESGCALPAGAHAFPGIVLDPKLRPRLVAIAVTRDGRLAGHAELEPTFRTIHPNGPRCPPSCDVATAVVDVEF